MYKNRSIKKVVEKTQRRQGTKSMGQKEETQPKTRLQLKRQMEKGFHGGRGWARGRGIDQRQRPQKQPSLRMNAVGPDLEHTQPRMYGYVVGFRWMGGGRKGSGAGYLERAIWSRGSGGTTWWANENNARVFHQPMP